MANPEQLTERFEQLTKDYCSNGNMLDENWLPNQFEQIAKEYQMGLEEVKEEFWECLYRTVMKGMFNNKKTIKI